ncbi:MAG: undecaprenyldiphospho-muramoylpentapeptide beta-N-acetylglucosaminyltransferase [Lachnospiraceae bacterium]|nr:undecaprenyldiphospho-muramoylpentapeptide beta-N-acetylglucosaminyltransferase [Lachnospiraceae bacterium]
MKKIVLTGGGTAGHVTANIALLPELRALGYEISYIGSYEGMEKGLIEAEGIPYYGVATGKFRRYLSAKNLTDPFRVVKGYNEAKKLMKQLKPDVVFSKGGFVAVPVVRAAKKYKIPVIIHESDMTPGLANKLCISAAKYICCNFPETVEQLKGKPAVLTGSPIRKELLTGSREAGLAFTGLSGAKPVLLMIGGSSGSRIINQHLRASLDDLLPQFDIIHLCGKGNLDAEIQRDGYVQYEYISSELKDLYACADVILSRAGANVLCELLALNKPNLLIPLSKAVSRGDQILNAASFQKQGFSEVLEEETVTKETLVTAIQKLYENRQTYIDAMKQADIGNGVERVMELIQRF